MLSGLVEFGFLLNTYLDVIDAAREAARSAANDDPNDGLPADLSPSFWNRTWLTSRGSLVNASDGRINWSTSDPFDCANVKGDIVISAFGFVDNKITIRYPGDDVGASNCDNYPTSLSNTAVNNKMNLASVGNSGAVLVEIYYEYEMLLGLPWITAFVPDPIVIHAFTIMPNTFAEPDT